MSPAQGVALLLDVKTRRLIGVSGPKVATAELLPPGSTVKPLVLAGLLRSHKLTPRDSFPCHGSVQIGKRSFDCTHPRLLVPLHLTEALSYSCNSFVAHVAERAEDGEVANILRASGLTAGSEVTGRVSTLPGKQGNQLQALGEDGVSVTPAGLANAYCNLARNIGTPEMSAILAGLEGAVEFGTAQLASVSSLSVAGKTGSVLAANGAHIAWFAGFAPSRSPEVVVTVMVQGRSGGGDAAPIAGKILEAYRSRRL